MCQSAKSLPGKSYHPLSTPSRPPSTAHAMTRSVTEPIRAELLSVERLEQLAETIAQHRVSRPPAPRRRAAGPRPGQRPRSAPLLPDAGRRHQRRAHADTRGRVAGGQLPHRRRGAQRDSHRSAARLLPPAPYPGRRAASRGAPRAGAGLDVRRPHRQPLRPVDTAALHPGLSAVRALADQRALGGADRASPDAARKPPPARRGDRRGACRPPRGRSARQPPARADRRGG